MALGRVWINNPMRLLKSGFFPPQGLSNQVVGLSRQKVLNWKASKEKIPSVPAKVGLSRQKVLKYRGLSSQVLL